MKQLLQHIPSRSVLLIWITFAVAMSFALFTRLAWDDWYITFRASKNLAVGYGFTFTAGERIHSFTSPLGALIPAAISYAIGNRSDDFVLWSFRIVNATFLGFAVAVLYRTCSRIIDRPWIRVALVAMCTLDAKVLANTINGMETALFVFFLVVALHALIARQGGPSTAVLGLGWSGLMWTRPDGIVYIVAMSAAFLLFGGHRGFKTRAMEVKRFTLAGLLVVALYGPWLVWAHHYYGSFVPHTIVAKGLSQGRFDLDHDQLVRLCSFAIARTGNWSATFMPPYATLFGEWPRLIVAGFKYFAWLCAFVWLVPGLRSSARFLSFTVCVLQFYLWFGMEFAFPWYYPPVGVMSFIVFALLIDQGLDLVASLTRRHAATSASAIASLGLKALVATVVFIVALTTTLAAIQLRSFQTIVYEGNYRQVGLWLREHAVSPKATVFLEPLGYIAYFSGLKMYDYPGLSSNEVVEARRRFPIKDLGARQIFADLIPYLKPDWVVLRPAEIALIEAKDPALLHTQYTAVKTFDVSDQVAALSNRPGLPWFRFDQTFVVFQRATPPP